MHVGFGTMNSIVDAKFLRPLFFWALGFFAYIASVAIFSGLVSPYLITIVFFSTFSMPFFYRFILDREGLFLHWQIFYIIPLLVSITVTHRYGVAEYLLQIIVMLSIALLCGIEIVKSKDHLFLSKVSTLIVLFSGSMIVWAGIFLLKFPDIMKFITLAAALSLFAALKMPAEKLLVFKSAAYRKEKNILFAGIIVFVYVFISFSGKTNFFLYLVYAVSVVNLGFSFRDDKRSFILFSFLILLASFIPFGPREAYVDSLLIVFVAMLFQLKSPILYYQKTKYGVIKVEYSYYSNKILLVNDGIIQGERFLSGDMDQNLRYFGNLSSNSIISSIFCSLDSNHPANIAVLGLGTGAMAMFGKENHVINFYEINPEIIKIAYNPNFFDYISKSKSKVNVILGDARHQLSLSPESFYSLICVDVYLGADIPNHFLTLEAIEMYLKKLTDEGLLVFHATSADVESFENRISNIAAHLNLHSAIAYERYTEATSNQEQGLVIMPTENNIQSKIGYTIGQFLHIKSIKSSEEEVYSWIVLSRKKKSIDLLRQENRWYGVSSNSNDPLYTDSIIDYEQKGNITKEVN